MGNEVKAIKTRAALLNQLRDAPNASGKELRDQRVSFAVASLESRNGMTREQVREIIERDR